MYVSNNLYVCLTISGGTAGAVSKITGSLGKGLAALAFDKNYQQRRTEQSRKIPSNSREAFALGGKELVMVRFSRQSYKCQ